MVARAVETTEEDHQVQDTILALEASFMLPTAQALALALSVHCQPPTTQQQAPPVGLG